MVKTKLEKLNEEQKKSLRDHIDTYNVQLINEESLMNQYNFDMENFIPLLKIKRKQSLKKIELLKSNIKVLNYQIRVGVQVPEKSGGEKNMAEDEEKKEDEAKEEEKSESESSEDKKSDEESSEESSEEDAGDSDSEESSE